LCCFVSSSPTQPESHGRALTSPGGRFGVCGGLRGEPFARDCPGELCPGSNNRSMAEIRWFGHNCFRIKSREATVLMDPVGKKTGYTPSKQTADIVTVSHEHP